MQNYGNYNTTEYNAVSDAQSMLDSAIYDYDGVETDEISENEIYSEQLKALLPQKRYAHPLIILALMIMCFPIGIIAMLCFTKWGAFPKILITLFVLTVAVSIYEILVAKQVLLLPSLIEMITALFTAN